MQSFAPESLDFISIKQAIAQALNQAQNLNQPIILTYSWDYAFGGTIFGENTKKFSEQITPVALLAKAHASDYKFYWQQKSITIAAIGVVASMNLDSDISSALKVDNRFEAARFFCEKYLTSAVSYGQTALGQIFTYALGGFAFSESSQNNWQNHSKTNGPDQSSEHSSDHWQDFPNAMLFIPKWLAQQRHNSPLVISFNHCIHPQDCLKSIEQNIIEQILEFPELGTTKNSPDFTYSQSGFIQNNFNKKVDEETNENITEVAGKHPWIEIVAQAVNLIKHGKLEKVVLARALDIYSTRTHIEVLNSLRQDYPECISFLINFGIGSFVGATPEILLQFYSDDFGLQLTSDAIAGSTHRGITSAEDQIVGKLLLASLKDQSEHAVVIRSIYNRLRDLGVDLQELALPSLKRLKNVQHIHTEIKGTLKNCHWLQCFEILRQLHPTAAVGGEPQATAVQLIQASEACDRGWYAAPIGWINSNGEGIFAVGIRSGYVHANSARIYAGAGIVADSDIASELKETAIKFEALLRALS